MTIRYIPLIGTSKRSADRHYTNPDYAGISYESAQRRLINGANVGIRPALDWLILDLDNHARPHGSRDGDGTSQHNGVETFELFCAAHDLPSIAEWSYTTPVCKTPSNGYHIYLQLPEPNGRAFTKFLPGIDVKNAGGYVVMAGSQRDDGTRYEWLGDGRSLFEQRMLAYCPAPILDELSAAAERNAQKYQSLDQKPLWGVLSSEELDRLLGTVSADQFDHYDDWFKLLFAAHFATGGDSAARDVFAEWSASSPKYALDGYRTACRKWDQDAQPLQYDEDGKTLRTSLSLRYEIRARGGNPDVVPLKPVEQQEQQEISQRRSLAAWEELERHMAEHPTKVVKAMSISAHSELILQVSEIIKRIEKGTEAYTRYESLKKKIAKHYGSDPKALRGGREVSSSASPDGFIEEVAQNIITRTMWHNREGISEHTIRYLGDDSYALFDPTTGLWTIHSDPAHLLALIDPIIREVLDGMELKEGFSLADFRWTVLKSLRVITSRSKENSDFFSAAPIILKNRLIEVQMDGSFIVRDWRASDFAKRRLDYVYNEDDDCPLWMKTLEKLFKGNQEMIGYMQRLMAYSFFPTRKHNAFLIMYGSGDNGKSTVVKVWKALLGEMVALSSSQSNEDKHGLVKLEGARVLIEEDLCTGYTINDGLVKKCVGDSKMYVNPKFQAEREARINVLWVICSNVWPMSKDASQGIQRRAHVIKFEHDFKTDPDRFEGYVEAYLLSELPGILNWVLRALPTVAEKGLQAPAICQEHRDEWLRNANPVINFVHSCLDKAPGSALLLDSSLYEMFRKVSMEKGVNGIVNRQLFQEQLVSATKAQVANDALMGWAMKPGYQTLAQSFTAAESEKW